MAAALPASRTLANFGYGMWTTSIFEMNFKSGLYGAFLPPDPVRHFRGPYIMLLIPSCLPVPAKACSAQANS